MKAQDEVLGQREIKTESLEGRHFSESRPMGRIRATRTSCFITSCFPLRLKFHVDVEQDVE